jgi:hypothetical protein
MLATTNPFVGIVAAVFVSTVSLIILSMLNTRQMRKGKEEDYARQDKLDAERKLNDKRLEEKAQEVADTAAEAAKLLLEAQRTTKQGTDEVARQAEKDSSPAAYPLRSLVTVTYPNGQSQEVLLADVPRQGDRIRLNNGPTTPSLIVEHVLWMEGRRGAEPTIVIVVADSNEKEEP